MFYQGTALVPGSCGELVQGTMSGKHFLVDCPVTLYSRVTVTITPNRSKVVHPPGRYKSGRAVRKVLDRCGCHHWGGVVEVSSPLPVGKGMASSTADLAASCYATASALGIRLDPRLVGEIALEIEPSDGTFHPGVTLFDHVRGELFEELGAPVAMGILVVDLGGVVDTLSFNRRSDLTLLNRSKERETERALELVRRGIKESNPSLIGKGATLSALANQRILAKPELEGLISWTRAQGGYGVNVAHSGTVAGILLPPGRERDPGLVRSLTKSFPEIAGCYRLRLTSGGPRYLGISRRRGVRDEETPTWREYPPDGGTLRIEGRGAD